MSHFTHSTRRMLLRAAGLGFVAGGVEAIGLAASVTAPVGLVGFWGLGLLAVAAMGLVAALMSLLPLILVHTVWRLDPDERAGASLMGLVGMLLCGWYLWSASLVLLEQQRTVAAVVFALLPLPFALVVRFNALYWLRRARRGEQTPAWWATSLGAGVLLALAASVLHGLGATGGHHALQGDPSVVLITIADVPKDSSGDGWTRADLRFDNAITPTSSLRGAAASVMTGLHPLRSGIVADSQVLDLGHNTLAEVFASEGYATAAFVASPLLSHRSGLAQGFAVYDDRSACCGAVGRISLFRYLGMWRGGSDAGTVTRSFLRWNRAHAALPRFVWIELPANGSQAALTAITTAVADSSSAAETLIIVAGLTRQDQVGLSTHEVRVPVVLTVPGAEISRPQIDSQVRLFDLAPTALAYTRLQDLPVSEGIALLDYGTGRRSASLPVVTLAADRIGLRSGGVAYEQDLEGGSQRIFDLSGDLTRDVSGEQTEAMVRAAGMLSPEVTAYRALLGRL